jgi:hypothetical protein
MIIHKCHLPEQGTHTLQATLTITALGDLENEKGVNHIFYKDIYFQY